MGFICDRESQKILRKASLRRQPTSSKNQQYQSSTYFFEPSIITLELDDIDGADVCQGAAEKKKLEDIERVADLDMAKDGGETIDYSADQ
jgi:hypothetical protein